MWVCVWVCLTEDPAARVPALVHPRAPPPPGCLPPTRWPAALLESQLPGGHFACEVSFLSVKVLLPSVWQAERGPEQSGRSLRGATRQVALSRGSVNPGTAHGRRSHHLHVPADEPTGIQTTLKPTLQAAQPSQSPNTSGPRRSNYTLLSGVADDDAEAGASGAFCTPVSASAAEGPCAVWLCLPLLTQSLLVLTRGTGDPSLHWEAFPAPVQTLGSPGSAGTKGGAQGPDGRPGSLSASVKDWARALGERWQAQQESGRPQPTPGGDPSLLSGWALLASEGGHRHGRLCGCGHHHPAHGLTASLSWF